MGGDPCRDGAGARENKKKAPGESIPGDGIYKNTSAATIPANMAIIDRICKVVCAGVWK